MISLFLISLMAMVIYIILFGLSNSRKLVLGAEHPLLAKDTLADVETTVVRGISVSPEIRGKKTVTVVP